MMPASSVTEAGWLVQTLSPIERHILRRMVEGDSLPDIASQVGLSAAEAQQHKASMMQKLGAKVTADAIRIGILADAGSY